MLVSYNRISKKWFCRKGNNSKIGSDNTYKCLLLFILGLFVPDLSEILNKFSRVSQKIVLQTALASAKKIMRKIELSL
jgi:hypothetical protein